MTAKPTEQTMVRYLFGVAFLVCIVGLGWTLGGAIAPWAGWLAGVLGFGIPAASLYVRYIDARDDAAEASKYRPEPANYPASTPEM